MTHLSFSGAKLLETPFPHTQIPNILDARSAGQALEWLKSEAPWNLRVEDFYEQEEFSLLTANLDERMGFFIAPACIEQLLQSVKSLFGLSSIPMLVDVNAHRLTLGQTIRIHNDYLSGEETHRLLIQLNSGWIPNQGGLLLLFRNEMVENLHCAILPSHRSGFAFEISERSFHAVSQIKTGERYTIVYTFRAIP
jgi:2OG-Fe(II) oxygenase superfamily